MGKKHTVRQAAYVLSQRVKSRIQSKKPLVKAPVKTTRHPTKPHPKTVSSLKKKRTVAGKVQHIPREQIINKKIKNRHTLAVCTIFNHEDPYLNEWVDFHLKQGVDHFYMYDNGSSKASYQLLKPYIKKGLVSYINWPDSKGGRYPVQRAAYRHCLQTYGKSCLWMAFFDVDEFLYTKGAERSLNRVLSYYNHPLISQIEVPRYNFGNCKHRDKPSGKVVINYLLRERNPSTVKSIVNPANINLEGVTSSVHRFTNLIKRGQILAEPRVTLPFKINHYLTKSTKEFEQRNAWWRERSRKVHFNPKGARMNPNNEPEKWNQVYDDDILHCL